MSSLYHATVEIPIVVWADSIDEADELITKYLPYEADNKIGTPIRIGKIRGRSDVPDGWLNAIPYGLDGDHADRTVRQLLPGTP